MRIVTRTAVAAMLALPSTLQAAIINVPGDEPTIQAGIDAAMNGDEVVVAPGTYFEIIDFLGKAITLRSSDGPDVTIIDGTGFFHVVQCISGEGSDTVLDGFTITGGDATGTKPNDRGGGMVIFESSPTVTNCTFTGNFGVIGGGMFNISSSPTMTNCTFSGNTATNSGGGMFIFESSPTMTDCTFSGNTAESGDGGGGMLNLTSSPTMTDCTFSGNSAGSGDGGGMLNLDSSPTMTDCTFSGNSAGSNGGGMLNVSFSSPMVINCTFSGNFGVFGGGMYNLLNSNPTVTNCTFSGNTATNDGGGMFNLDSSPTVTACTFCNNVPDDIAGPFQDNGGNIFVCVGGACCLNDSCIVVLVEENCITAGGTYQGNNTTCKESNCTDPCPADIDGDGNVGINDFLDLLAAWGPCP